jgi:mannose-6-phosphate isomerase-like protein (cupin superfamily)
MPQYFIDSTTDQWTPHPRFPGAYVMPLITRDHDSGLTASRVRLMPGAEISTHVHSDSTETFFILQGSALCAVGSSESVLLPGFVGFAPPGIEHRIRNLGDEPVEAISIFNPPL